MGARFHGLDRLKALALWAMLLHHVLAWMVGDARHTLGDGQVAVTDLAAPAFAFAAGAAATLVGLRLRRRDGAGTGRVVARWAVIAAWGVALGARGDLQVDTVGVLETLAVVGLAVTLIARWFAPGAVAWALLAVALTAASGPVIRAATDVGGWWAEALGHRFPWVSYLAMAAAGAAAISALGDRESRPRLAALAGGGAVVLAVLAVLPVDAWPVDRYPSDPSFIVPGVVAALAAWALLAALPPSALTRGMERAGQRTLLVYVGHHVIRAVLDAGGWYQSLDGPGWTAAAVAIAATIAVLSTLPSPRRRGRAGAGRDDAEGASGEGQLVGSS